MSKVLLTGANGFVAVHILDLLLSKGYNVVGTVRSESKKPYLQEKFANHADKLELVVVDDITAPGAWDAVLEDTKIEAVLHTSSPFFTDAKDVEKELYSPAIHGTTRILESIHAKAPNVKKVVVLSSFASIIDATKGNRPGYAYTDADWNPITYEQGLENGNRGYYASKKYAERAAWDFVEKAKPAYTLTTLCPPMVYGPPEQEVSSLSKLNASTQNFYNAFIGKEKPSAGVWIWVDVRNLAQAHVAAIESPAAAGQRYLISEGCFSPQEVTDFIWKHYPERATKYKIDKGTPGQLYPEEGTYHPDNSKSRKDLGLTYNLFDKMCEDLFARFIQLEEEGK